MEFDKYAARASHSVFNVPPFTPSFVVVDVTYYVVMHRMLTTNL